MVRKKIAVTGASGQVGSELRALSEAFPQYEFVFLTREDISLEDSSSLERYFSSRHFEYLVNCAAYTAVDKAETEEEVAFQVNAVAVEKLALLCAESGTKLIHISTDYVYDGIASEPYREDAATGPQGVYGASKLVGENRAMAANPSTIIIRTSWVYSSFGKNFVRTMLRLMSEREEISVVSDQYGSPTYAADLASAIMAIISGDQWHPGVYHYSNEGVITWYEFALAIKELSGSKCLVKAITTAQYPTPAKRPAYSAMDKTLIKETFGLSIRSWDVALAEAITKFE